MVALKKMFPHETQKAFQVLCEVLRRVSDLGPRLEELPGDIGKMLEDVATNAFSDVCHALTEDQGGALGYAIENVEMAGACLEAVRVLGHLGDSEYGRIRQLLLDARDLLEDMYQEAQKQSCKMCELIEEDQPS